MATQTDPVFPQLLASITELDAEILLADSRWWMQEKHDGVRMLVRVDGQGVAGWNRRGFDREVPEAVASGLRKLDARSFAVDGELVGEHYVVFDLLEYDGQDFRRQPYATRYLRLVDLFRHVKAGGAVSLAYTSVSTADKQAAFATLRSRGREGVVFKDRLAKHHAGRHASQRKFKFINTASVVVTGQNPGARSVAVSMVGEGGERVDVGNCTVPAGHNLPSPGEVVEVRYLYATDKGRLFQPVYLGVRDDVTESDCGIGQLRRKGEAPAALDAKAATREPVSFTPTPAERQMIAGACARKDMDVVALIRAALLAYCNH